MCHFITPICNQSSHMSIHHVPPGVELFATSQPRNPPEFNSLNWPAIAPDFEYSEPKRPLAPLYPRGLFQEAAPQNLAIPPGIPMSYYIDHKIKSRVSRPGDAISGLVINQRNVEKVEKVLRKSYPVNFYTKLNMHSKEHAERWLKNAKKSLEKKERKGGANKSRKSGKSGKTRKSGKSRKTRKARH